jgi:hypothetical protein
MLDRGEHQFIFVGPPAIQHGNAGTGSNGHGFHGQLAESDGQQLIPSGVEQRGL